MKFDWYQNTESVVLTIYEKNIDKEKLDISIHEMKLTVIIKQDEQKTFCKEIDLFDNATLDFIKFYATKLVIFLKKTNPGRLWSALERNNETKTAVPYPSSSRKPVDWSQMEQQVKKEEELDKPQGEDAVNEFFKSIYQNASEDVRKAMNKSFQESGGTCLSTNWQEVSKAPVKISPPDGAEAKKFES